MDNWIYRLSRLDDFATEEEALSRDLEPQFTQQVNEEQLQHQLWLNPAYFPIAAHFNG